MKQLWILTKLMQSNESAANTCPEDVTVFYIRKLPKKMNPQVFIFIIQSFRHIYPFQSVINIFTNSNLLNVTDVCGSPVSRFPTSL